MEYIIPLAIPSFAFFISIEFIFSIWKKTNNYLLWDTITNISLGFGNVLLDLLWKVLQFYIFSSLYVLAPFHFPSTWWTWTLLIILDDFFYYWFHRISHESKFFWNLHVVHHSSEYYNLSVAVRQSWFGGIFTWIFYIPLPLLGFSPDKIFIIQSINLLYQFWIHTQFIQSLGFAEYVVNSPSHHRVHHATNQQYLDKNYSGIFIIWDRLFGTFEPEKEVPRYGILKQVKSFNPFWINLHSWRESLNDMKKEKKFTNKLKYLFLKN